MGRNKNRKIKASKSLRDSPSLQQSNPEKILFSFRLLNKNNPKFNLSDIGQGYLNALFDRLKNVSEMTKMDFITAGNKALRGHQIKFVETTETEGFPVNEQFQQYPPFQFSVSVNEHGRVHGLFIDHVFYVIWLDPNHELYSK